MAPENTAPAFELALNYGADVLEIDVRLSRDKRVMVIHDSRIDRTCNGQGEVSSFNENELKKFDAGWNFKDMDGIAYRGKKTRLMTLNDLLEQFPDTRINIDIKDNSELAAKAVADCLDKTDAHQRVNIGSFHAYTLNKFRAYSPQVTTAASQGEVAKLYFGRRLCGNLKYKYLQIPTKYYGIPLATERFIRFAKSRDVHTVYWTINSNKEMEELINKGVGGIVTDRVDLASRLLGKSLY